MIEGSSDSEPMASTPGAAAQLEHEENLRNTMDISEKPDELFGDPPPPSEDSSREEKETYKKAVQQYSTELLDSLKEHGLQNEQLWIEFTCSFRMETVRAMSTSTQISWVQFLLQNGVYVQQKRGYARWKSLVDCLQGISFKPSRIAPEPGEHAVQGMAKQSRNEEPGTAVPAQPLDDPKGQHEPPLGDMDHSIRLFELRRRNGNVSQRKSGRNFGNHDNSQTGGYRPYNPALQSGERSRNDHAESSLHDSRNPGGGNHSRRNGVETLMKAYSNRSKYSGAFTEDFDGAIEQFETLASLCELSDEDMAKGFPIMLTGAAFSHYSRGYAKKRLSYSELVDAFRAWYTSEEQRCRLLQVWQRPSLLKEMKNKPEHSEVEVFREVSDELIRVQHQLHRDYHSDRFLRDQLLVAADIPHLRRSLIDKIPATAQEAMQRIAILLSSEPRSAGANFVDDEDGQVLYGLGKTFGGQAKKQLRGTVSRKRKPKLSQQLAAVDGCWVCGKNHRARGNHDPSEIIKAVERIKKGNPATLFTVEDMVDVQTALLASSIDEQSSDSEMEKEDTEANVVFSPDEQQIRSEAQNYFSNVSFVHGRTFSTDLAKDLKDMDTVLAVGETSLFNGIIIDTGCNRVSAMCLEQYKAYCREFCVPMRIDYAENRSLVGLGGIKCNALGTAVIPIPFSDLNITIDVKFRIMKDNCQTLLSLRDMLRNGLDIIIQNKLVSFRHKMQELSFEHDFLKHKWSSADTVNVLYTEKELQKLHRNFGHPSVSALQNLLRRATPEDFGPEVKQAIDSITKACKTCALHL